MFGCSEIAEPTGWSHPINIDGFDEVAVQIPQGRTLTAPGPLDVVSASDQRTMNVMLRIHVIRNAAVSSGLAVVVTMQTKMMVPAVQVSCGLFACRTAAAERRLCLWARGAGCGFCSSCDVV